MSGCFAQSAFPLQPLGRLAGIQLGKMLQSAPGRATDREVPYMRAGHLTTFPEDGLPTMWASPGEVRQYCVEAGDLLVAEGGDAGRPEFAPQAADGAIIQNSLHRLRAVQGGDIRFLRYALLAVYFSDWLDVLCNRSTFGHLTVEKLSALHVPVPPGVQQRGIADFLDTETACIDALITKKRRMIDLLEERWLASWARLVLPSGSDLLPPGWRWVRSRHLCSEVTVGVVVDPSSYFVPEGDPFIHGTDVRRGWIDESKFKFLSQESNMQLAKSQLRAGDIVAMRVGEPGRAAVVPPHLDGANCASVLIFRRSDALASELLAAFLNSRVGRSQIESMQYGAAQGVLNVAHAKELRVPVPPQREQSDLVNRLYEIDQHHRHGCQLLGAQIRLLVEHRQALITAAVTGELEVPEVAA